jgi:pyruvate/2-oxoglutarate/acetoin dehydrogenase E1 component
MYGKRMNIPLVIRTPMGGRRGYGPTHSQNLENMFFGIPNVVVYAQNMFFNPNHIQELLEYQFPTVFIEHKDLYNQVSGAEADDFYNITALPQANVLLENRLGVRNCLIITYGYAASIALEASSNAIDENEIFSDIL